MSDLTVAILGAGTMGRAIGERILQAGVVAAANLAGTEKNEARAKALAASSPFPIVSDNVGVARRSEVLIVCTKPDGVRPLLHELALDGALAHHPLIISIAAGMRIESIEAAAGETARVIRAMPNTPALIGEGMTVLAPGAHATAADLDRATALFEALGRVIRLDEKHMDAVTGLSGSGPAFVYVIIEALAEGGVMMGLPRGVATELAAQTVKGAARMVLETGRHPASLKDDVTTPAGCTVSALLAMEDGRLRSVLARGVQTAAAAAAGLGEPVDSGSR